MFKEYRKLRKYTQEQLSSLTGIDIRTIQKIENEEHFPNLITFSKIVTTLDIKTEDLRKYLKELSKYHNKPRQPKNKDKKKNN